VDAGHGPDLATTDGQPFVHGRGSCHCAVTFETISGTDMCDCSIADAGTPHGRCTKTGSVFRRKFTYQYGSTVTRHFFCKTCGIYPFIASPTASTSFAFMIDLSRQTAGATMT
jgi:hypothetical protein